MADLGKFTNEHWISYLIVVLSAIFGWPFAVLVPLFILWIGFVARKRHRREAKQ